MAEDIIKNPGNGPPINLKGIAVGNGCWGSAVGLCNFGCDMDRIWQQFLYGHSAISKKQYNAIVEACGDPAAGEGAWSNCTQPGNTGPGCSGPNASMAVCTDKYNSKECQGLLSIAGQSEDQRGPENYDIYHYYDTCYAYHGLTESGPALRAQLSRALNGDKQAVLDDPILLTKPTLRGSSVNLGSPEPPLGVGSGARSRSGGALNDYGCGGMTVMYEWMNTPEVMAALHVQKNVNGAVQYGPRQLADARPIYKMLAQKIDVMIYSGDTDACVPTIGTEEWTAALGFPVLDDWRPWHAGTNDLANTNATHHAITAGYVTTYDASTHAEHMAVPGGAKPHNFTFITVKGSGQ